MNNNANFYEEDNLDYENEILEESETKQDDAKDSVMKDINKELKSLKKIQFKDFREIMNEYHKGDDIITDAATKAFYLLKSEVIKEMFSDKYADQDIISISDKVFDSFISVIAVKLRRYDGTSDPVKYFRPCISTAIQLAVKQDKQNKHSKNKKSKATDTTSEPKYDYSCSVENPSASDFADIILTYQQGDKIRKAAIDDACINLKGFIIYTIMHSFWTYCRSYFFDMLQCGYMGVLKGMATYNPDKALPTTFFKTYIKCEITRYITEFLNGSTVHYATTLAKVNRAKRYYEEIGVEPKESAIAEYLGISPTSVREALASQEACINVNYQDEFENATDEDVPTVNNTYMNPEKSLEQKLLVEAVAAAINDLTAQEKTVIMLYYGFEGEKLSPNKIAVKTGMSTDTVKQLHQKALNKLYSSKLGELYDNNYKEIPGIETIEFLPETEEEAEIVEFTFEDFISAKTAAIEEIKNMDGEESVEILPNCTTASDVSYLFGM